MGTRARIATVCQGRVFYPSVEQNRDHMMGLLDLALSYKPDLVCLPEVFTKPAKPIQTADEYAEDIPGPTLEAVMKRAREHQCYIICPMIRRDDGCHWNSAVVVDRGGDILGIYDKVQPVTSASDYTDFEQGVRPGSEVPVFDLDFGRVGIQICFDAGFPEGWAQLAEQGARLVLWPSAYNGGFPLQVYACLHHYYVVSAVQADKASIIDPCGRVLSQTDRLMNVICRDINLDYLVCHYDFNFSIPDKIMAAYPGQVEIRSHVDDAHFLIEPVDERVTIAQLRAEFGIESTSEYHQRHREAYRHIRQGQTPAAQVAAHGERLPYQKW